MSIKFSFGEIPVTFDEEQAEFLRDILTQIQAALETGRDLDQDVLQPPKQADGMLRYSPGGYDYDDGPGFYGRIAGNWQRFTAGAERLLGAYDQVLDRTADDNPLVCADQAPIQAGDYYLCSNDGICSTLCPDISGQNAGYGDKILSDGVRWSLIPISEAYLSSEIDDTAKGVITFNAGAKSLTSPIDSEDLTRKSYVDVQDAAHAAQLTDPNDIHGSKTYTDQEIASLSALSLATFSFAGYGGLEVNSPVPFSDIGLIWRTIDVFDLITPTTPRGVTASLVTHSLSVHFDGVYKFDIAGTFEHDSSNQGRITYIRFWDVEDNVPLGTPAVIGTGRNAEATSFAFPMLFEITDAQKNHRVQLEIGGGDIYTAPTGEANVIFDFMTFMCFSVSEWREPFEH